MCNSIRILQVALVAALILTICTSCSEKRNGDPAKPKQEAIPAGALMDQSIRFQYAIYYLPSPLADPLVALQELLSKEKSPPTLVNELPDKPGKPVIYGHSVTEVQTKYAPPDTQSLQYFGRGLTRDQAEQLQKSRQVFIMEFAHDKEYTWEGLRMANEIAEAMVRETGGLVWDEMTREVFTPVEWNKKRIQTWTQDIPDVSDHTSIHAYKSDEYVRAITLGMAKFGLPDVVVEDLSWSLDRTAGHLINLFCQAMAEGAVIEKPGEYDLDIRRIQNSEVREAQITSLKRNATAVALLSLKKGEWEEGDPENRLIELGFDRYSGRDVHAKQAELFSSFFGSEDAVTPVTHSEELLAASRKAKARLPALREEFLEGLDPGEFIQVKAPFKTPDGGQEWMWVEITTWEGDQIKGLLKNEPFNIPSLHGGQIVNVKQQDVFDYIRRYRDGRQEGNETGAIIQKMQQTSGGQ